jgi:hypothetical protein
MVQAGYVNDTDLMLPGEFGAATRLSPKALRLYAEQGLLVPACTDPGTGYRRYHSDGPVLVHFHGYVTRDSDGPVEAAVPFTGSVEPIDDLRVRISPAGTDAFVPVAGADADFPGILRVYDALEAWIDAHQLVCTGSPVEIWPGTNGAIFDVTYPVATSEGS